MFKQADLPTLHRMQAQSRRIADMVHWRAVQAFHAAFGQVAKPGDHLDMCVLHNSLVGFETGQPWREVNYSQMRRARWLVEKSWEPNRLVNAWYRRKCGIVD